MGCGGQEKDLAKISSELDGDRLSEEGNKEREFTLVSVNVYIKPKRTEFIEPKNDEIERSTSYLISQKRKRKLTYFFSLAEEPNYFTLT